jgi:hypothetical protein
LVGVGWLAVPVYPFRDKAMGLPRRGRVRTTTEGGRGCGLVGGRQQGSSLAPVAPHPLTHTQPAKPVGAVVGVPFGPLGSR